MSRSVEVSHYMVERPVTVHADDTVLDAARKILEYEVSGACVVDANHNLLGMLSELDCLRAIVERIFEAGQEDAGTVRDIMTANVNTNEPGEQIIDVAAEMLKKGHRRRPIVDGGKLAGQVTCRQILKAIKDFAGP